jgi:hypothetical protein
MERPLQTLAVMGREFLEPSVASWRGRKRAIPDVVSLARGRVHRRAAGVSGGGVYFQARTHPGSSVPPVLVERRKALHERTGPATEVLLTRLEDHHSDLAHHYSRSGTLKGGAISPPCRTTSRAPLGQRQSTLSLWPWVLKTLPDTSERAQHELTMQPWVPLMATKAGQHQKWSAYAYGRVSSASNCETGAALLSASRTVGCYDAQAKLVAARGQLLGLAENTDPALLLVAQCARGHSLLRRTVCRGSHPLPSKAAALYDRHQHHAGCAYGTDPGVACGFEALSLWVLGYQTAFKMGDMLTSAHELPSSLYSAHTQFVATWLYQWSREAGCGTR